VSFESLFRSSFDFDESVRVDREASGEDREEKLGLLENYYVTDSAEEYLRDLFARILGEAEGEREGFNHWLYGYYGSGKSHLLAVTGLLLDSKWVGDVGREMVWKELAGERDGNLKELRRLWRRCLEEYRVWPLFVNLLKEQGDRKRGFGNVILRRLHEKQGLSPHLKVAFFEQWYLRDHTWEELQENAQRVLQEEAPDLSGDNLWSRVQKYPVLADGALPVLFEDVTGSPDGYSDVVERNLKAEVVAQQLEDARQAIERDSDSPSRLLLLLDEITLFIGTKYGLLTELNALAEAIDEVGEGKILTVGTAQEDPSRVQTEYSAREVDFSILDDRFPHQFSLPSSHVGEIVKNRLLRKTDEGHRTFGEALSAANLNPGDSLVFYDVQQNTDPPLDQTGEEVLSYLPLLPYQPPLFLEILSQLRTQEADLAKSIFSGTARAILAIVNGLLERWGAAEDGPLKGKEGNPSRVVSLVDFFEVIRPELEDIAPQEINTIKEVEKKVGDDLQPIDEKVCKVVLLLQRVPDMIPLDDIKNIAAALMDDLNGETVYKRASAVKASLGRLGKYIRVDQEHAAYRRFTTQEERSVLDVAETLEREFGTEDVLQEVTRPTSEFSETGPSTLWAEVLRHLELPTQVPYEEGGDPYPVQFEFDVDGHTFHSAFGEEEGLQVQVHVDCLLSGEPRPGAEHAEAFLWSLEAEGWKSFYEQLKEWAALSAACRQHTTTPPTLERELQRKRERLPGRLASRIQNGTLKVGGKTPESISRGVELYVRRAYSSGFHPEMLRVDTKRLRQLEGIRRTSKLPDWAATINVVCDSTSSVTNEIVSDIRGGVGKKLRRDGSLSVDAILAHLEQENPDYEDLRPALVSHLWGLSQRGDFQPVSEEGDPLRAKDLLDSTRWHEIQIRLGQGPEIREHLERVPDVGPQDSHDEAVYKVRSFLERQQDQVDTLRQQIRAAQDSAASDPVKHLFGKFQEWLTQTYDSITSWSESTRSSQPDWETVVDKAIGVQDQIRAAQNQWENREAYLLQLDALLVLYENHSELLPKDVREALDRLLQDARMAADTLWWTDDGWTEYVDRLGGLSETVQCLRDWWTSLWEQEARQKLLERTADHPWLVSSIELPTQAVGRRFETEYLHPLRSARQSMKRAERILKPLTRDAHDVEAADVRWALGKLQSEHGLHVPPLVEIETQLRKLRVVEDITQGAAPTEVAGVGIWPRDRDDLTGPLEELVRRGESPSLTQTEHGLILTA